MLAKDGDRDQEEHVQIQKGPPSGMGLMTKFIMYTNVFSASRGWA